MLKLIPKIPLYKSFRATGRPGMLPMNLTLNVTYHCPSRCQTCNVWKKQVDEFTLEEWTKTFQSIGRNKIYWLILSGGEPFMRKDLPELAKAAYQHCRPAIINIPTNGFLSDIIPSAVEKILANCPQSQIVINFSLDGIGEKHDAIRNLENSFERMLKSYSAVRKINNPRLTIGIHSVISKLNFRDIPEIYTYATETLQADSYITEIAERRVELDTLDLELVPAAGEYSQAADFLMAQIKKKRSKGLSRITQALRLNYYALIKQYNDKNTQILPCYAAFASGQISADGEVWPCCVRGKSLGSLRKNSYNFKKIWFGEKAAAVRRSIKNKECSCPLASASYTNMLMDPRTLSKIAAKIIK